MINARQSMLQVKDEEEGQAAIRILTAYSEKALERKLMEPEKKKKVEEEEKEEEEEEEGAKEAQGAGRWRAGGDVGRASGGQGWFPWRDREIEALKTEIEALKAQRRNDGTENEVLKAEIEALKQYIVELKYFLDLT